MATYQEKDEAAHYDNHPTAGSDDNNDKTERNALSNTEPRDGNLAAKWLAQYTGPRPELTDALNNKVRNRIDANLLPLIFLIYFNQQLDKSAVAFAAVFNFRQDAGLVGAEYGMLTTIIYVAQLIFQPLSVYALVRFKVNIWIISCFVGWSASCMIMASFRSYPGLLALRFFLGAFEASIAPTMMIIVSTWWTRREQPLRNNLWYSANGIALILGSLIAFGLGHITQGALYRYQYIFLVNGSIGFISLIPVIFLLPSHITTARFLTDEQKYLALERIRLNNTGTQDTEFKWKQVFECLTDLKQWMFVIMVFCASLVSGGISAFGPIVLGAFGLTPYQTILYNTIPGAIGIVANLIAAYFVQQYKRKAPVLAVLLCFPVAAAAALYALPRNGNNQALMAVYFILQIFQPLTPIVFSWTFANTAGHTKKTTTTAMLFIGLCAGNMVGPQLYLSSEAPIYRTGLIANLAVLSLMFGLVLIQTFYLIYLNKRNDKRRAAMGKTGRHIDYSLENSSKWAQMRAEAAAAEAESGEKGTGQNVINEHAFEDLTDKQNEDFIYSL